MDTKKWINFMIDGIEDTHKKFLENIKKKGFDVKEEENSITFEKKEEEKEYIDGEPFIIGIETFEDTLCRNGYPIDKCNCC